MTLPVPGATFYRSYDGVAPDTNMRYPATVSTFALDKYEVTVGRFRAFVDAGMGTRSSAPASGAGAHPLIPGTGWNSSWNMSLPFDTVNLRLELQCDPTFATWTDSAGANEDLPINCTTWWEAFAFCDWDGGRLPTEAEWNYAAAGGSEQREYPWGSTAPDASLAVCNCLADGDPACAFTDILPVGSKPAGNGKYGHADLAGSIWEWVFDTYTTYAVPCVDCAANMSDPNRVYRGGYYENASDCLKATFRGNGLPMYQIPSNGIRCARAIE